MNTNYETVRSRVELCNGTETNKQTKNSVDFSVFRTRIMKSSKIIKTLILTWVVIHEKGF